MVQLVDCNDKDIVIDTNVWLHAQNGGVEYHEESLALLRWLRSATNVRLSLDDTGKAKPDPGTSKLYAEYVKHFNSGGLAHVLLTHLLSNGRVQFVARPDRPKSTVIRRLVPGNVSDRAVLGAACMSQSGVLVSNDYADFSLDVRIKIRKVLHVELCDAAELV